MKRIKVCIITCDITDKYIMRRINLEELLNKQIPDRFEVEYINGCTPKDVDTHYLKWHDRPQYIESKELFQCNLQSHKLLWDRLEPMLILEDDVNLYNYDWNRLSEQIDRFNLIPFALKVLYLQQTNPWGIFDNKPFGDCINFNSDFYQMGTDYYNYCGTAAYYITGKSALSLSRSNLAGTATDRYMYENVLAGNLFPYFIPNGNFIPLAECAKHK